MNTAFEVLPEIFDDFEIKAAPDASYVLIRWWSLDVILDYSC
jgi:hypothetical protein